MNAKVRVCPRCHRKYVGYPALSREDNKTEICSECGIEEALECWFGGAIKKEEKSKKS